MPGQSSKVTDETECAASSFGKSLNAAVIGLGGDILP